MKRIFKDRKTLTLSLCLIIVCVFTLTVAYSALSVVLTINGNARVSAADWDIYLNNPRVTSGSATTNEPVIKTSSTLEFETTLNMPGDFYEFVVDVVNAGDIDAMIENVVKTPELTTEQTKFLKYEVSYQNGESITTKQLLAKDTTMPIKVRIEYRKDLSNSDLPTGQVVLDLALTLEYTQSDGSGTAVNNNGAKVIFANGDISEIGTIVTIGSEQFYTIGTEGDNVKLLSMYNLYVGNSVDENWNVTSLSNPTGIQDKSAKGYIEGEFPYVGTTRFSSLDSNQWDSSANVYDSNSIIYNYVENYKKHLENYGLIVSEARLIELEELIFLGCSSSTKYCHDAPDWVCSTTYWTETPMSGSSNGPGLANVLSTQKWITYIPHYDVSNSGVRPVIVISKDYFN